MMKESYCESETVVFGYTVVSIPKWRLLDY